MQYLNEYREGQRFSGVYLCKEKKVLQTKAGKTYYALTLQDKSGSADAKVWELGSSINNFERMDYIQCDGQVTTFQGAIQMNVARIRVAQPGEYDEKDYIPTTKKDMDAMMKQLLELIESVKEPHLKVLLKGFFVEDKEFSKAFKKHSAAKSIHHAVMGGLLEHTLAVANQCDYMAKAYPMLNRDLVVTAALFHDMGKLDEISYFPENDYTDNGQLLGHIYMGTEKVSRSIDQIPDFPPKLASELKHCILAHHGKLEYGSPKVPALMEAMALFLSDFCDSKMQTMTEIFSEHTVEEGWLGFNRLFESNLRRTSEQK